MLLSDLKRNVQAAPAPPVGAAPPLSSGRRGCVLQEKRDAWNSPCASSLYAHRLTFRQIPGDARPIKTSITFWFPGREGETFVIVWEVVWGRGTETSHPFPALAPCPLLHPHRSSAAGLTTALFIVPWARGVKKMTPKTNEAELQWEGRTFILTVPNFQYAVGFDILNVTALLGTKSNQQQFTSDTQNLKRAAMFKECLIDIDFNLLVLKVVSLFEVS